MKVTVLCGGPSAEREVSKVSGRAVIEGLRLAGHEVFGADINPNDLSALDHPADVIFPVLHGAFGESGELQEILESRGLAFVGCGSAASRIGIDKAKTKQVWLAAGLPTAPFEVIRADSYDPVTGPAAIAPPCVVKAIDSGSSIDVFICKDRPAMLDACRRVLASHPRAMVERFIDGIELTVGILEEKPLDPIRITTTREFFDYTAKYEGNFARHHFDTHLDESRVRQVRELARRAHEALGGRDLSRIDMILDAEQRPFLLEINTMPGFTPKSLLPEAAAHAGIEFPQLVDRLVRRAKNRIAT